jgi:hypothetical protein
LESFSGSAPALLIQLPKQGEVTAEHVKATMTHIKNATNASLSVIPARALLAVTSLQ